MSIPRYRRVLFKLSGEILAGDRGFGILPEETDHLASQIKFLHDSGLEVGIVIGAGNIFRGISGATQGLDRVTGDYMGMTATLLNAVTLKAALKRQNCPARVMSAIHIRQLAESYIRDKAVSHIKKSRVVIFAGGTGNPYFTTDTAAALRAIEINADILVKGTRVDGVYDSDPEKNPDAVKYDHLTYQQVLTDKLKVMDLTAVTLCQENDLPILVLNTRDEGNIQDFVAGRSVGTMVDKEIPE